MYCVLRETITNEIMFKCREDYSHAGAEKYSREIYYAIMDAVIIALNCNHLDHLHDRVEYALEEVGFKEDVKVEFVDLVYDVVSKARYNFVLQEHPEYVKYKLILDKRKTFQKDKIVIDFIETSHAILNIGHTEEEALTDKVLDNPSIEIINQSFEKDEKERKERYND